MERLTLGDAVISLRGHDRETVYVVVGEEGSFVRLADGKSRTLSAPKKKNRKHVKKIGAVDAALLEKLRLCGAGNEEIKYFLKAFGGKHVEIGCD